MLCGQPDGGRTGVVYRFGDCELDTARYELRRAGVLQRLEPQVFGVLAFLVAHRDRVVTRDELLDAVWGHRFVSEATISSRLRLVRRAVGDSGASQGIIRTIRGRGYRFVTDVVASDDATARGAAMVERAPDPPPARRPAGRDDELRHLHRQLDSALAGTVQVVWLVGEAGIGKSTLLEAFLSELAGGRVGVARGQCIRHLGAGEPYMPVLEALTRLGSEDGGQLERALALHAPSWAADLSWAGDAPDPAPPPATPSHERRLRELVDALHELARRRPLVLAIEDLHWSDPSTVDLIAILAHRPDPAPLMVVATYRPADARAELPPLVALAREHSLRGRGALLELGPLDETAIAEHVAARLGAGEAQPELAELLHRRTEGNPLFLACVMDAWIANGLLGEGMGDAPASSDLVALAGGVPESLRQLLDEEIRALDPADQAILEAAAVTGVTFAAAAAASGADADAEGVEARLAELARDGRLVTAAGAEEWPDGTLCSRFSFIHQLHQEALYERMPAGARAAAHRRVGERLERALGALAPDRAVELADHFVRGRDRARAARYLALAGRRALARYAWPEAVAHLRAARAQLAAQAPGSQRDAEELELQLLLAPAVLVTEGWAEPEAERAYERARELGRALDDVECAMGATFGLAAIHEMRGNYPRSEELLEECLTLGGDSDDVADFHELLACSLFHQGEFARALAHADQGVLASRPHPISRLTGPYGEDPLVGCHDWAALALFFLGDSRAASLRMDAALETAAAMGLGLATSRTEAARLRQLDGDRAAAATTAAAALHLAREHGFPYQAATAEVLLGWSEVTAGQGVNGLERMRRGLDEHAATGAAVDRPYLLGLHAQALAAVGHADEALAVLDEALAMIDRGRPFFYEAELRRLRGDLRLREGDLAGAEADLEAAIGVARRQGSPVLERRARDSLGDAQRVVELGSTPG